MYGEWCAVLCDVARLIKGNEWRHYQGAVSLYFYPHLSRLVAHFITVVGIRVMRFVNAQRPSPHLTLGTVHSNRLLFLSLIEELAVLLFRLLVCIDTGAISQFPVADVLAPSRLMFAVHPLHLSFNWFTPEPINQRCLETVPLADRRFRQACRRRRYPSLARPTTLHSDQRNEVRPQQKFRFTATFREKC